MELVIHTIDRVASTFEVENGPDEEHVLTGLHPDKAFGHHHLVIQGRHGVAMFVSSKVTYVELCDLGRKDWPFYDMFFEAYLVPEEAFGVGPKGSSLFAHIFLTNSMRLTVRIDPLSGEGGLPGPGFVMDQLLSLPSIHIHGSDDRILLVNTSQIIRCDFSPCPKLPLLGWRAETSPSKAAVASCL